MATAIGTVGSVLMQARWNWAENSSYSKWTAYHQVYRHVGYTVQQDGLSVLAPSMLVVTKNKVRGQGSALKLRFKAEADKDFVIYGWTIQNTGEGAV